MTKPQRSLAPLGVVALLGWLAVALFAAWMLLTWSFMSGTEPRDHILEMVLFTLLALAPAVILLRLALRRHPRPTAPLVAGIVALVLALLWPGIPTVALTVESIRIAVLRSLPPTPAETAHTLDEARGIIGAAVDPAVELVGGEPANYREELCLLSNLDRGMRVRAGRNTPADPALADAIEQMWREAGYDVRVTSTDGGPQVAVRTPEPGFSGSATWTDGDVYFQFAGPCLAG